MPVQYYLNLYGGETFLKGTVYLIGEEANLRLLTNAMSCLIDLTGHRAYTPSFKLRIWKALMVFFR